MDVSKGYDYLPQDLLIANFDVHGFDNAALALINDYLTNHLQWVKIGSTFSSYLEILRGFPQGSYVFDQGNKSLQFCRWYIHVH